MCDVFEISSEISFLHLFSGSNMWFIQYIGYTLRGLIYFHTYGI